VVSEKPVCIILKVVTQTAGVSNHERFYRFSPSGVSWLLYKEHHKTDLNIPDDIAIAG
jgi:hypothetical protein